MFDVEKSRKEYSMLKVIGVLFKNLSTEGIVNYLYLILNIISEILVPFFIVLIPAKIVNLLTASEALEAILIRIMIWGLGIIILDFIRVKTQYRLILSGDIICNKMYSPKWIDKMLTCSIQELEDSKSREALFNMQFVLNGGDGAGQKAGIVGIYFYGLGLIVNVCGFLLYATITGKLSWILVVMLIVTSIINCIAKQKSINYEFKKIVDFWENNDRFFYLRTEATKLQNAKDIRMYHLYDWFRERFTLNTNESFEIYDDINKHKEYSSIVTNGMTFIQNGIAYIYLIFMITQGQLNVSSFILYMGIVTGFSTWIYKIIENYTFLSRYTQNFSVFLSYISQEDKNISKSEDLPLDIETIDIEHIDFSYGDNQVFKDFSLHLKKGEKTALVGINGAGKTTLVKLISGLYRPDKGKILINGIDVSTIKDKKHFERIAPLFQDVHILPFSIAENVSCQKTYDEARVKECLKQAGLLEHIETLPKGIDTMLTNRVDPSGIELSGGQLQRLMLARALYKNAPVLILDEPTSALDPIAESELYEEYAKFTEDRISVFISHRLSSTRFCDRILFMEHGKIIEEGNHDELMSENGSYASMYEVQAHYYQKELKKHEADIN